MKNSFIFLLLCFLAPLQSSPLDPVPVSHKGRIIPFQVYAHDKLSPLKTPPGYDSSDYFLSLYNEGNLHWSETPIFKIKHKRLREMTHSKLMSYNKLTETFQKNAQEILNPLLSYFFLEAEKTLQPMQGRKLELKNLSPGLWVKRKNQTIEVIKRPNTFPWFYISEGTKIPIELADKSYSESILELLSAIQLYESFSDKGKDSLFLAIPGKNKDWVSLNRISKDKGNFSLYSDKQMEAIKKEYQQTPLKSEALISAYQTIEGKPYLSTAQHTLYYPTSTQLRLERYYFNYPIQLIVMLFFLLAFFFQNTALITCGYLLLTFEVLLRCYLLGRPPVSNMAETLIYVPWVSITIALAIYYWKREKFLLQLATLTSIMLLTILYLSDLDLSLQNPQAVLNSQFWLATHVLLVVASYGAFILSGALAHLHLITSRKTLSTYILTTLYIGTVLLITGTILGGVWAAQSWGRFWDWDPKESWAFISSCLYVIIIHLYRYGKIGAQGLSIGSIIGMLSITFTWYGVNFILGTGLHSYGFGSGGVGYYISYLIAEVLFLLWYTLRTQRYKNSSFQ